MTRRFSDYNPWPDLTETAVQDGIPTESYGNFGLSNLRNPKCTGHTVYGRVRKRNGRRLPAPPDQWLWSPESTHPAIVDRATWGATQEVGAPSHTGGRRAEHGTSRDGTGLSAHRAAARVYPYRGRIRRRHCRRRMSGLPRHAAPACTSSTGVAEPRQTRRDRWLLPRSSPHRQGCGDRLDQIVALSSPTTSSAPTAPPCSTSSRSPTTSCPA